MLGAVSEKEKMAEQCCKCIALNLKGVDEKELFFRIGRATPLKKLMDLYCRRLSEDRDTVVFLSDGRFLSGEKTPDELGLKDGDEIEAKLWGKHITLKIKDLNEKEVLYTVNCSTPLKKLMNDFCDRRSVDRNAILFIFDGRSLSGERTPDELGLKDGDAIEAEQRGKRITLKVEYPDENEVLFRIKRSTPLKELMNAFCDRLSLDRRKDIFVFFFDGRILCGNKTPDDLGLEDGDEIDAIPRLRGCICGCGSYSIT